MTILVWDKPDKVNSTQAWEQQHVFDGGPPGGYVPNMSDEDAEKWRAKLVGHRSGHPQVEIRKTAGSQILLIVSLGDGYKYKSCTPENTKGVNVHLSLNGAIQFTFAEMQELNQAVNEAREYLLAHATTK